MTTKPEAIAQIEDALAARSSDESTWHICTDPASMREVLAHIEKQDVEIARLRNALEGIAEWRLPALFDKAGKAVLYEFEYGSNGARDHIRGIASAALTTKGTV